MTSLHSPRNQALRDQLRTARESRGITQVDLALKLDKPQSFVSKYETGERRLDVLEFAGVCNALNLDAADFLRDFLAGVGGTGAGRKAVRR